MSFSWVHTSVSFSSPLRTFFEFRALFPSRPRQGRGHPHTPRPLSSIVVSSKNPTVPSQLLPQESSSLGDTRLSSLLSGSSFPPLSIRRRLPTGSRFVLKKKLRSLGLYVINYFDFNEIDDLRLDTKNTS